MPPSPHSENEKQDGVNESRNEEARLQGEAPASNSLNGLDTEPNGFMAGAHSRDEFDSADHHLPDAAIVQPGIKSATENESISAGVTIPEPIAKPPPMRQWSDLTQSEQLDVLWTLCEWQFTGVMRLRNLLGEEDSGVGWVSMNTCPSVVRRQLTDCIIAENGTSWMGQQEKYLLARWG